MRNVLLAFAIALSITTVVSHAQVEQVAPPLDREGQANWFVELSSPPTTEGSSIAMLENEEAVFYTAATAAGVQYARGRHFHTLWNGVTIRAAEADVPRLQAIEGVQAVYPVTTVELQQAETPPRNVADLITALTMTGADIAQRDIGVTGRGVKVAVIDTGIDYDHPDLGGCFGPGCRVETGFDLVGDAYDAATNPIPSPDPFPDDCNGHGTHVSGIVGANGTLKGVAPGVTFHAYRVFGCTGVTSSDIMLAAMEMAFLNGADVVNMSIGSAFAWPKYPTAQGADLLVRLGVVVVASIGNEGGSGLYSASAPGVGKNVIGVASFDNTFANLDAFTISPDDTPVGYVEASGAPAPPDSGTFPVARTGTSASVDDACAALPADSLAGAIALIRRGTCTFYVKAANAQAAGAVGVVIYNNMPGFLTPTVTGTPPITIPVVLISAAKGVLIDERLASGPVDLTWTSSIASEPQSTGGLISSFSSFGVAPDLSLKPDIGAPGGVVRSTLPLEQGGFGNLSGTSMASPHVAGAVALLLEARPETNPNEVRTRLQNTAFPQPWFGNPALGFLDNVHRQGAGMLDINEAILSDVLVSPSRLALGEVENGSITAAIRLKRDRLLDTGRRRRADVVYTLGHQAALATGSNTFVPTFFDSFASVAFSQPTVTVGPGEDDTLVAITFTISPDAPARLFGGYITLTPDDDGPVLRVPYAGYNGDYQAITVLTPTPLGLPLLAKSRRLLVGPPAERRGLHAARERCAVFPIPSRPPGAAAETPDRRRLHWRVGWLRGRREVLAQE
jgi:minor extracellular serine protease Vpr